MDILENAAPSRISPRTGTEGPANLVISMMKSKGGFRSGASFIENEFVWINRAFKGCTLAMMIDAARDIDGGLRRGFKANQTRRPSDTSPLAVRSGLLLPSWVASAVEVLENGVGA